MLGLLQSITCMKGGFCRRELSTSNGPYSISFAINIIRYYERRKLQPSVSVWRKIGNTGLLLGFFQQFIY